MNGFVAGFVAGPVDPPDVQAAAAAADRLEGLATPPGALGRLGDLGVWLAGCQGEVPPRAVDDVRLVIFAGDHGVAAHGVSAFPPSVTPLMVQTFVAGRAGVSALAAAHGVAVRVLDLGVDCDPADLPEEVTERRVRRGSGAIHLEDALTPAELREALDVGAAAAAEGDPDLLISGDMGIGNTTPAAALVAASLGLAASDVTGIGTGIADDVRRHKQAVVQQALDRTRGRHDDPLELLAALGSADLAASSAFIATAARRGVPVLLDGLMAVACALVAERLAPGTAAWCRAGHRSPEPAQALALAALGLEPLLDLGMRLGEGSGAVAAVPLVRSAAAVLRDTALLADVLPPPDEAGTDAGDEQVS